MWVFSFRSRFPFREFSATLKRAIKSLKIDFRREGRQRVQIITFNFTWKPFSILTKSYLSSYRLCSCIYSRTYLMGLIQPRPRNLHDSIPLDTALYHIDSLHQSFPSKILVFLAKAYLHPKEPLNKGRQGNTTGGRGFIWPCSSPNREWDFLSTTTSVRKNNQAWAS